MAIGAVNLFLFFSGLILIGDGLGRVPQAGETLKKFANWLSGFGVFIGVIDVILAVL